MAEFTRTFKGGNFTYVCRDVKSDDVINFPAGVVVTDVWVERVVPGITGFAKNDVVTAGGDAGDALILGDVITSTADFTSAASKKATLGVGIGPFTAITQKVFTKTDADADTKFNCYVSCKKIR